MRGLAVLVTPAFWRGVELPPFGELIMPHAEQVSPRFLVLTKELNRKGRRLPSAEVLRIALTVVVISKARSTA